MTLFNLKITTNGARDMFDLIRSTAITGVEETNMKVSIAHRVENHSVGARERLHILFFYMV